MRISIRQRLTAWYAAALLLGLALFAFGMWIALHERVLAGVDARLALRIRGLQTALGAEAEISDRAQLDKELGEFVREVPDGSVIQVRGAAGPPPASAPHTQLIDGRSYRVAATRLETAGSSFDAEVAMPLEDALAILQDFRRLLLWMIPGVLLVACLGGYWLSSRALRPVDEITTVARSIGVQNLSQRLAVPQTGDELQRMAQTWNEVLARLEISVQRIRQFTSDASHELRTPLALIRATSELALRRDRDPEEYRASLRQIEREAAHMTTLTESLLTLARADSGALGITLQPTDFNTLIESVVHQHSAAALARNVTLRAITAAEPARAGADEASIRRVLLILLDNALKHTPAGGTITVSATPAPHAVTLAVEDTGDGIPADALPHIFERFYHVDPARGSGSGFGLGLSIAQAIAHAHGSAITATSSEGAGARFSLTL
ncbi:MAG: putative Heavy metal sensor signal transduction histidine kinase [Candidatus Solibacter sp.]|nr:putative Heavy metal sensor signal transduction histidine kinase [Candidatus Solibacter sp.]